MGLFGLGRKKEETGCCGAAAGSSAAPETERAVKVLGSGCEKCQALEKAAVAALTELSRDPAVEHVTDFAKIAQFGVMQTPALVVDGRVVSYGRVLTKDEVKALL